MDWNKVGSFSALGCLVLAAVTFAIQIWPVPQLRAASGQVDISFGGPKLIAAFLIAGFVFAGIAIYGAWRRPKSRLTIHSAVYGTGPINDRDVTARLRSVLPDAVVIPVENNFFGIDPAPMQVKRLQVDYSYGNQARFTTSRQGHDRMVLPEGIETAKDSTTAICKEITPESIALSEEKKLVDKVNRMSAKELRDHSGDKEFVRRFEAIPKNKYRELPNDPGEPDRYIDTFQQRAMALSRELREFVKELGPDAADAIRRDPREDNPEGIMKAVHVSFPRISKMHHGYERRFKDRVIDVYHEMREHNLIDGRFEKLVARDSHNEEEIQEIADCLWTLAGKLDN